MKGIVAQTEAFQARAGLKVDGLPGRKTLPEIVKAGQLDIVLAGNAVEAAATPAAARATAKQAVPQ